MTCFVKLYEKPMLSDPVLIEGLPGIGLVANLSASFLIKELNAKLFGEIYSSSFQDVAITTANGGFNYPINKLYYYKREYGEHDLILLYGNTQALTSRGQYELCWQILELVEKLGCTRVITIGGYRPGREVREPKLYYAASDPETAREVKSLGIENLRGEILGAAGLLVGLCRLRKMKGFCLLAETPGDQPDKAAAREVLKILNKILELNLDLSKDISTFEEAQNIKPPQVGVQAYRREFMPEWFI